MCCWHYWEQSCIKLHAYTCSTCTDTSIDAYNKTQHQAASQQHKNTRSKSSEKQLCGRNNQDICGGSCGVGQGGILGSPCAVAYLNSAAFSAVSLYITQMKTKVVYWLFRTPLDFVSIAFASDLYRLLKWFNPEGGSSDRSNALRRKNDPDK